MKEAVEMEPRKSAKPAVDEIKVDRDGVIEVIAYLLSSAELCTREPYHYGTFRLLDGASRLAGLALRNVADPQHHWLWELKQDIDDHKGLLMWEREAYFAYLQEVTGKIVQQLRPEAVA
jgi:hypothetical protein